MSIWREWSSPWIEQYAGQEGWFYPISLGDWLTACRVGYVVPSVQAELVAVFEKYDLLHFKQSGPHRDRLQIGFDKVRAARQDAECCMMRWDHCAPLSIKAELADGNPEWSEDFLMLEYAVDDPRCFEFLYEFPRLLLPAWIRPWMPVVVIDRYPVEYRVYVDDGQIVGISNYYPQRPLPFRQDEIEEVERLASRLLDVVVPPFRLQTVYEVSETDLEMGRKFNNPSYRLQRDIQACTMDFIVTQQDEVLFLEGGPSHRNGAHNCCFLPDQIEGIALEDRNEQRQRKSGGPNQVASRED